jgi:uncharacterized membrane protein YebE (DUF533 family)
LDAERLLGSLIRGAVSKKKRHRSSLRFLTGGRGSFLNASTLLAAAGIGWGLYETMKAKPTVPGPISGPGSQPTGTPPPLPPLPTMASQPATTEAAPPEILRLIRLTVSAARADGALGPEERSRIIEYAREAGAEELVQAELDSPKPLSEIVAGPLPLESRRDMYVLAFAIVRADESVSGAEQIYLAQLAHLLGLDSAETTKLEQETVARIEAEQQA